MTDESTAFLLLTEVFLDLAGFPIFLKSDRGAEFIGGVLQCLNEMFEIKHVFGTAYHPSSQWPAEIPHKTVKNILRSFCRKRPRDWDKFEKKDSAAVLSKQSRLRPILDSWQLYSCYRRRQLLLALL